MKIFLIIAAIVLLLLFVPLSLQLSYRDEIVVRIGVFYPFIKAFSTGRTTKLKKKEKKEQRRKEKVSVDKKALWDLVKRFPGYFRRLLTVTKLHLNIQVGHEDPGDLALIYGSANAIVDTAAAVLSPIYPREKWKVLIIPDFNSERTSIEGKVCAYTNFWRIIYVLISLLICGILSVSKSAVKYGEGVEKNG